MHSRATSLHCRVSPWTQPSRRSAGKPREVQQHISRCCTRLSPKQAASLKQHFRLGGDNLGIHHSADCHFRVAFAGHSP